MYFFVDESGDPNFLGKGKRDLLKSGKASHFFIVGHAEIENLNELAKEFSCIRENIKHDQFINQIPSVHSSLKAFHANKDAREIQERVFRVLKRTDFSFFAVVIEKDMNQFVQKFNGSRKQYYAYLVERLLENRLHQFCEIDIYFAKMHSVTHEENMWQAIEKAQERFEEKWNYKNRNKIRVFMQQPSQIAGLQLVDYCLWSLHRVYHHQDFRYYNYLNEKISLVHDLNHGATLYGTYFTKKNLITRERFIKK